MSQLGAGATYQGAAAGAGGGSAGSNRERAGHLPHALAHEAAEQGLHNAVHSAQQHSALAVNVTAGRALAGRRMSAAPLPLLLRSCCSS